MRVLLAILMLAPACFAAEFVHAVEFPYHQYPRRLWERELVWLKNIGVETVAVKAVAPVATDPRTDLTAFIDTARRVGLRLWLRETAPEAAPLLRPHARGLIRYSDPAEFGAPPPQPVSRISAIDRDAQKHAQQAIAKSAGSILWTDVEDVLTPVLKKGAVSLNGEEADGARVLKRTASFLRLWGDILPSMRQRRSLTAPAAFQLGNGAGPALVWIANQAKQPFEGEVRVFDPRARRLLRVPALKLPAAASLWMPVNVKLRTPGICEDCDGLPETDRLLYATAELQRIEFENGVLAFEFHAPFAGEAILQLSKKPHGPVLAGGVPKEVDWDVAHSAARIPIPAGKAPLFRQRVAIALDTADSAAFFSASREKLIQGVANRIVTSYSSELAAGRAKFIAPAGYAVTEAARSNLSVEYDVTPPAESAHGEFVTLAIEVDGVRMAKTRAQVLAPLTLRMREAEPLRFGADRTLPIDPPVITVDPRAGRSVTLLFRNNMPSIENFTLEFAGEGVSVAAPKIETSVGASAEREIPVRVFLGEGGSRPPGLPVLRVRVEGRTKLEKEFRIVALARGQATSYSVDLDGDGTVDHVLENQTVRAAFSGSDGRWMEYVAKDRGTNLLPDTGMMPLGGAVRSEHGRESNSATVTLSSGAVTRTMSLAGSDSRVVVTQNTPIADSWRSEKRDGVEMRIERGNPGQLVFSLTRF